MARKAFGLGSVTALAGFAGCVAIAACATIVGVEDAALDTPPDEPDGSVDPTDGSQPTGDATPFDDPDSGCVGRGCPCSDMLPCKDTAAFKVCLDATCVACAKDDDCAPNTYCLPSHECVPGCRNDAECVAISPNSPFCNPTRHQCVQCKEKKDCEALGPSYDCSPAGTCATSCELDAAACPAGQACCGTPKLCVDIKSDVFNCNGCGIKCEGAGALCCAGECVKSLTDRKNCGRCGVSCSSNNATPSCQAGSCEFTCSNGFAHCGDGNTGCETDIARTPASCGSCFTNCNNTVQHASNIGCAASRCTFQCAPGFANCDSQSLNGCECQCGITDGPCCVGGGQDPCQGKDFCGGDGKCHVCRGKDQSCNSTAECCNRGGKGCDKGKCDK